jgi:chaperonin GroEL (HSP60 family)
VNAFADSLEVIPRTLAENAGLDPIEILTELRARHEENKFTFGLDVSSNASVGGEINDTFGKGIIEPLEIKIQALRSASEVAIMILRIDDVIASSRGGSAMPPQGMPGYD